VTLKEVLLQSFGGRTPVALRSVQVTPTHLQRPRLWTPDIKYQLEEGWLAQAKGVG